MPRTTVERPGRGRIGHDANSRPEQPIEVILDQDPKLPVDGNDRQPSIARLLQAFNQQGTVGLGREDVRVEVVALDLLGVGQDDLADAERRDLRPETPHHFRPRNSEQQVDARPRRNVGFERAAEDDGVALDRLHSGEAARSVEQANPHLMPRLDVKDVHQMSGAAVPDMLDLAGKLARLEDAGFTAG